MLINRRDFTTFTALGTFSLINSMKNSAHAQEGKLLRLGGPVFEKYHSPEEWVTAVKNLGYRAAYCPVGTDAPDDAVRAYRDAARQADIVIAEVGAWSNLIDRNDAERKK